MTDRLGIICPRCSPMADGRFSPMPPQGHACRRCGSPGHLVTIELGDSATVPVFVELDVGVAEHHPGWDRPTPIAGAVLSDDGLHRYHLWRLLTCSGRLEPRSVLFVMLNPSTADHIHDDQTIRKCMGFARRWHMNRVDVVNLFSFRASSPKALAAAGFPNGPEADQHIGRLLELPFIRMVVVGWGAHAKHHHDRVSNVTSLIASAGFVPMALKINDDGSPRHPCYVPYDAVPQVWPTMRRSKSSARSR